MKLSEILRARYGGIKKEHEAIKRGEAPSGFITTGLKAFDRYGGIKRKMVTLFGADTGGGKSLWKLHLARAAATAGYSVTIVDLEDPVERTADRAFSSNTGIDSEKIGCGDLDDMQVAQIAMAVEEADWAENVELFDGVLTGEEALALFEENPADLEMLDYYSAFPHGQHGREREISDFQWGWTAHVQKHDLAGVGFAQIHQRVSERGLAAYENHKRYRQKDANEPPYIEGFRAYDTGDLMWCTDIGRNCKETYFMTRPGRIYQRLKWPGAKDNRMEFDAPKRNWGREGRITVGLDLATARFYDLPEKDKKNGQ